MPEGHTLHRLAGALSERFAGQPVRVTSPQGRFAASASLVSGQVLVGADSWGKHLFVEFAGHPSSEHRFVHVHLGLIGKLDVYDGAAPPPVGQVRMRIEGPASYADLRGATVCELVGVDRRRAIIDRLGPDPLRADADPERAWRRIRRSPAPIGALLMDQRVMAGVGNVYRAELLFRHRMHPLRPGKTLRRSTFGSMWDDLVDLMADGLRTGRIDTVRAEHAPEATGRAPRVDAHGGEVYVYRRDGQPCHVCGSRVRTAVLGSRNLFWCARCQPKFRSRAAAR
jgi:formamidopyrimidine-DNA glycosylase